MEQINTVLLTNLNWLKGLKAWNKVFKFFENEQDLLDVVKVGQTRKLASETEQPAQEVEGLEPRRFYCNPDFSNT